MSKRVYKTVFGIETGDVMHIINRSSTSVYEVIGITRPLYVHDLVYYLAIHTLPVFTLVGGVAPGERDYAARQGITKGWINEVRCQDGRYSTCANEIQIEKRQPPYEQVIDMFESYLTPAEPYVWQPGVDYAAGDARLFNCRDCGLDFNGERIPRSHSPLCPHCKRVSRPIFIFDYGGGVNHHHSEFARWLSIT